MSLYVPPQMQQDDRCLNIILDLSTELALLPDLLEDDAIDLRRHLREMLRIIRSRHSEMDSFDRYTIIPK